MKLIIGLGNPGLAYANSRHNLGARALKAIAKKYRVKFRLNRSFKSRIANINIQGKSCLLAIPNTFMNLSGEAVSLLLHYKKIVLRELLIIHDDIDLKLGVMRFKKKGSFGGHKGIGSIIEMLKTQEFSRLRLGIGRSFCNDDIKDYVLSCFSDTELKIINPLIQKAVMATEFWVKFGIDKSMNEFNQMRT